MTLRPRGKRPGAGEPDRNRHAAERRFTRADIKLGNDQIPTGGEVEIVVYRPVAVVSVPSFASIASTSVTSAAALVLVSVPPSCKELAGESASVGGVSS